MPSREGKFPVIDLDVITVFIELKIPFKAPSSFSFGHSAYFLS